MLLSQTAVYGLRALAVLAALAPGEGINGRQLAERTRVPREYLSKVMRRLVLAKLVQSQRGHGGGFRLRRPPAQILVRDVLGALDLELGTECAFGYATCNAAEPCALHPLWSRLREGLDEWIGGTTFAQLTAPPRTLPAAPRTGTGR
jgi:Rrf2 family iron-sulfur cluster assembly transcriptional regulator